jgi:hypothetical protein
VRYVLTVILQCSAARIKSWGDVFVASASAGPTGQGYNISSIWTQAGWQLPAGSGVSQPTATSLVESMDENVLVSVLGCMGRTGCTPLV